MAGDLWDARYRSVFERMAAIGMVFVGPQAPDGRQIPACLWFLSKGRRNHQGEMLFIDARKLGHMLDRTRRDLSAGAPFLKAVHGPHLHALVKAARGEDVVQLVVGVPATEYIPQLGDDHESGQSP